MGGTIDLNQVAQALGNIASTQKQQQEDMAKFLFSTDAKEEKEPEAKEDVKETAAVPVEENKEKTLEQQLEEVKAKYNALAQEKIRGQGSFQGVKEAPKEEGEVTKEEFDAFWFNKKHNANLTRYGVIQDQVKQYAKDFLKVLPYMQAKIKTPTDLFKFIKERETKSREMMIANEHNITWTLKPQFAPKKDDKGAKQLGMVKEVKGK